MTETSVFYCIMIPLMEVKCGLDIKFSISREQTALSLLKTIIMRVVARALQKRKKADDDEAAQWA